MPRKVTDVIALLKKQGVEVSDDAAGAARDEFGELEFVTVKRLEDGAVEFEGKTLVPEGQFKERGADIIKWKETARAADADNKRLKEAMDAGDSENKRLADKWKKAYETQQPLVEAMLTERKGEWNDVVKAIPENVAKYLKMPKEGEELSDVDIVSNLAELKKLQELGAWKPEEQTNIDDKTNQDGQQHQKQPYANRAGGGGGKLDMSDMTPGQKLQAGYKNQNAGTVKQGQ